MTDITQPAPSLKDYGVLAAIVILIMGIGGFFGAVTGGSEDPWFQALNKPAFNPPGYLFGIVWPILYALMGLAVWRIWRLPASQSRRRALRLFLVQLVINFAWSFIFFSAHQIAIGAVWIGLLVIIVLFTMRAFGHLDRISQWLLVPYLAWISFATILNSTFWALNS